MAGVLMTRIRPLLQEGSRVNWLITVTATISQPLVPPSPAHSSVPASSPLSVCSSQRGRGQPSPGSLLGKIHGPVSQNLRVLGSGTWVLTGFLDDSYAHWFTEHWTGEGPFSS